MGFVRNLKNGWIRLMYGRNGVDQLGIALVWACVILDIGSLFLRRRGLLAGSIVYLLTMALWVFAIYRIFSKNLYRRREENSRFLRLRWAVQNRRRSAKERRADHAHKYFTCPACKTICRVPVGKGKVEITCPKCGGTIHGKT